MATCKDCIHTDVCRLPFNTSEIKVEFAHVCRLFKNKAQTVSEKEKVAPIDVVEVTRCKDCVFWDTEKTGWDKECVCKMHSVVGVHCRYTNPTDYCSYGEKREGAK